MTLSLALSHSFYVKGRFIECADSSQLLSLKIVPPASGYIAHATIISVKNLPWLRLLVLSNCKIDFKLCSTILIVYV
ncbi:hypothetical protein BLOT_006181 [Blomia tropicalis]|nr:hypothetical protein BLOT_006181 [Blomia tropicalis]